MRIKLCLLIVVLYLVTLPDAQAYLYVVTGVQRLGPALKAARIVYGRIEKVTLNVSTIMDEAGPGIMANFHVEKVISDQRKINRDYSRTKFTPKEPADIPISYHPQLEDWPSSLVPMVSGQHCILVCGPAGEIRTVLPAGNKLIEDEPRYNNGARKVLEAELARQIATEKRPQNLRTLIAQFADVAEGDHATNTLTPFLDSQDPWLRRAALAGLAYMTASPTYIRLATADMNTWFKRHKDLSGPENADLLACYFFLGDQREGDSKSAKFLPLYRVILDSTNDYVYGVNPISNIGTRDDIKRLYRYHNNRDVSCRAAVVHGISRILNLGLPNYTEPDFTAHEAEFQRWIARAVEEPRKPAFHPDDPRLNRFEYCYFSYNDYCYTENPNMEQSPADVVARLMAGEDPANLPIKYKLKGSEMNHNYCKAQAAFNKACLYENAAINAKLISKDNTLYDRLHQQAMTAARTALNSVQAFLARKERTFSDPNLAKCHALLGNDTEAIRTSKDTPYMCTVITLLFIEGRFNAARSLILRMEKELGEDEWGIQMRAMNTIMLAQIAQAQHDDTAYQAYRKQATQTLKKASTDKLAMIRADLVRLSIEPSTYLTKQL